MNVIATSYFPTIAYLKGISQGQTCVLDYGEHYVKQTFRNRCSILSGNGKLDLSIPVIRPNGNKSSTSIVEVSPDNNWRRDHWRSISAAYASAPYFEHYQEEIKHLIFQDTKLLVDFNQICLNYIQKTLGLTFELTSSEEYVEEFETDFRNFQFPVLPEEYTQVIFGQKEFEPNLSVLDALFCLGPMARKLIIS